MFYTYIWCNKNVGSTRASIYVYLSDGESVNTNVVFYPIRIYVCLEAMKKAIVRLACIIEWRNSQFTYTFERENE